MSHSDYWQSFLTIARVPADKISKCVDTFLKYEIHPHMSGELEKRHLSEMGFKDVEVMIAILGYARHFPRLYPIFMYSETNELIQSRVPLQTLRYGRAECPKIKGKYLHSESTYQLLSLKFDFNEDAYDEEKYLNMKEMKQQPVKTLLYLDRSSLSQHGNQVIKEELETTSLEVKDLGCESEAIALQQTDTDAVDLPLKSSIHVDKSLHTSPQALAAILATMKGKYSYPMKGKYLDSENTCELSLEFHFNEDEYDEEIYLNMKKVKLHPVKTLLSLGRSSLSQHGNQETKEEELETVYLEVEDLGSKIEATGLQQTDTEAIHLPLKSSKCGTSNHDDISLQPQSTTTSALALSQILATVLIEPEPEPEPQHETITKNKHKKKKRKHKVNM